MKSVPGGEDGKDEESGDGGGVRVHLALVLSSVSQHRVLKEIGHNQLNHPQKRLFLVQNGKNCKNILT